MKRAHEREHAREIERDCRECITIKLLLKN
jgi:hypothetical protein